MYKFKPGPNETLDKNGNYFRILPKAYLLAIKEGETIKEAMIRNYIHVILGFDENETTEKTNKPPRKSKHRGDWF